MTPKWFIFVLVVSTGLLQYRNELRLWFSPPVARQPGASNHVIMYSTTWCGYCAKTRTYLRRNGIPFEDRDVELTDSGNKEYNALGGGGVPILLVHDKVIRGYKPDAIDEALAKSSKAPQ